MPPARGPEISEVTRDSTSGGCREPGGLSRPSSAPLYVEFRLGDDEGQFGSVSADFARARVRAKRWYALHRGVYAVGHEALTPKSHFIAAVYACGPGSLLSHRAAGALQGLLDATAVIARTGGEEFNVAVVSEAADAQPIASQVCQAIAGLPEGVTASVGTACAEIESLPGDGTRLRMSLNRLVAAADEAATERRSRKPRPRSKPRRSRWRRHECSATCPRS